MAALPVDLIGQLNAAADDDVVAPGSPGGASVAPSAPSADVFWELAPVVAKDAKALFMDRVKTELVQSMKRYGGPQQYLRAYEANRAEFAVWLLETFPLLATVEYQATSPIPHVLKGQERTQASMNMHVSKFTFDPTGSNVGAPSIQKAEKLLEQYLVDGFLTGLEPLLVMEVPLCWDGGGVCVGTQHERHCH